MNDNTWEAVCEAQDTLVWETDKGLVDRLADVCIAIAYRREITPHQVLRDALASFGFTEEQWPLAQERLREHYAFKNDEVGYP